MNAKKNNLRRANQSSAAFLSAKLSDTYRSKSGNEFGSLLRTKEQYTVVTTLRTYTLPRYAHT